VHAVGRAASRGLRSSIISFHNSHQGFSYVLNLFSLTDREFMILG
jgi:hypothetical protein